MKQRKWTGHWIIGKNPPDNVMCFPQLFRAFEPAAYLRSTFRLEQKPSEAKAYVCGLGLHECYVNGTKVDDRVLTPVQSQYDKHVMYLVYDIAPLLHAGKNAIAIHLGNGAFNQTDTPWFFQAAPSRDYPKLLCDVEIDGQIVTASGKSWRFHESPVRVHSLRNGERYDARMEVEGFSEPEIDDSTWQEACTCYPPPGAIVEEDVDPCRVVSRYEAVKRVALPSGATLYDFGTNLTGWCEIEVTGPAGAEIILKHGERLHEDGSLDQTDIAQYTKGDGFQEDHYILKGTGTETYHPHFNYHGFRYVEVSVSTPELKLEKIQACFIHSDFPKTGTFDCSDSVLNRLQQITRQAFLCNYTGIPTDCPTREKSGWSGDWNAAMEAGLWNFGYIRNMLNFELAHCDTQRVSGQVANIAPCSVCTGYNGVNGPAFESSLFEIPWRLYLHYGEPERTVHPFYEAMARYLEYLQGMAEDNILDFGLGDWKAPNPEIHAPVGLITTAIYYRDIVYMTHFAKVLGKDSEAAAYQKLAQQVRISFDRAYRRPDGLYADCMMTSLAAPLCLGLTDDNTQKVADKLAQVVRENHYKANFGIFGAKYTIFALSDHGYADEAYEMLTQPEYPGWGRWLKEGLTTLPENFDSNVNSLDHAMFGGAMAWFYRGLGGLKASADTPGFTRFVIQPVFPKKLDWVKVAYQSPCGLIRSEWKRQQDTILCNFDIPAKSHAEIILPGIHEQNVSGIVEYSFQQHKR